MGGRQGHYRPDRRSISARHALRDPGQRRGTRRSPSRRGARSDVHFPDALNWVRAGGQLGFQPSSLPGPGRACKRFLERICRAGPGTANGVETSRRSGRPGVMAQAEDQGPAEEAGGQDQAGDPEQHGAVKPPPSAAATAFTQEQGTRACQARGSVPRAEPPATGTCRPASRGARLEAGEGRAADASGVHGIASAAAPGKGSRDGHARPPQNSSGAVG